MIKRFPIEFSISVGACIYGSLLLLILPLHMVVSIFIAATVHEFSHILLLYFFRVPIFSITLDIDGAAIETAPMLPEQELFCAAAGPVGSFLCLLFIRRFPLLALFGCVQGAFNLLPVYPLDGGRILYCFCKLLIPKCTDAVCQYAKWCTVTAVALLCALLTFYTKSYLFLLLSGTLILRLGMERKFPCKQKRY